jgi:hypothetical protein
MESTSHSSSRHVRAAAAVQTHASHPLRGTLARLAPAVGLFVLSPLVAEFLLGNLAVDALPALLVLGPMYGGAAVLIREVTRRAGRGWPTIILLALAYGLCEEGLVTQSLFNPGYAGVGLLDVTYVPALGIGVWWTLYVLTLHTVWSMSVPIALMEATVPARSETPWLGNPGLAVAAILFALGAVVSFAGTYLAFQFVAPLPGLVATVFAIVVAIAAAFTVRGCPSGRVVGRAPSAWLVGAASLVTASLFMVVGQYRRDLGGWPVVALYLAMLVLAIWLICRWSRQEGWSVLHRVALAGGALLTYAWHAFPEEPILGSRGMIDLVGNTVFALGAVGLLVAVIAMQLSPSASPR